jgi:hypothetical protein
MEAMQLRVLKKMGKYHEGLLVTVEVGMDGLPSDTFWRRRLQDSVLDRCVEVVQDKPAPKKRVTSKEGSKK